ncbi:DUF2975 domain-containing protein [Parvibaculum sp. MBR-TMA-1.3b-4.2]|jgi:hypothetical protein
MSRSSTATKRRARIRRVSRIMEWVLLATILALPVLLAIGWAMVDRPGGDGLLADFVSREIAGNGPLSVQDRVLGFLASLVPLSVILIGLRHLRALFSQYSDGTIFGPANARHFRGLAIALLCWVPAQFVGDALASLAVSLDNAPGHRFISLGLSSSDLALTLIGATVLILSWVMVEAAEIADDNARII